MTLSKREEIRREALRRAGGIVVGLSTTVTQTTTAVTADELRGRGSGEDDHFAGWVLYDPADTAADIVRAVTGSTDLTGILAVSAMAAAKAGTETVELYPRNDPGPYEFDESLNRALSECERIVESALPTVAGAREYGLLNLPWVEERADVTNVYHRASPNLLDNGGFELWGRGADAQLQGWVLSGTDATVTRVDGTYSRYAARLTSTGGNGAVLTQTIPIPIIQLYGKTISGFARIRSGTAAMASVDITDGTDTTQSSQHDGGSDWDELTVTHTVNADAQGPLEVKLTLDATDGNADFETVIAVEGSTIPEWLSEHGDQHARTARIGSVQRMVQMRGSQPVIVPPDIYGRGSQLVIQSRQRYFELTADSGTGGVTDMPFEAAVAGLLVKLAEQHIGGANAAKWEALGNYWIPKWERWRRRLREPAQNPSRAPALITGA